MLQNSNLRITSHVSTEKLKTKAVKKISFYNNQHNQYYGENNGTIIIRNGLLLQKKLGKCLRAKIKHVGAKDALTKIENFLNFNEKNKDKSNQEKLSCPVIKLEKK